MASVEMVAQLLLAYNIMIVAAGLFAIRVSKNPVIIIFFQTLVMTLGSFILSWALGG